MKFDKLLLAGLLGCLASCESMNRPLSGGDFDPLRPPGSGNGLPVQQAPLFKAGQFVRAAIENTAFFNNRPKGEGDADKVLPRGTSMKVIAPSDSYLKVELDSGEIGFVPTVMVEDPSLAPMAPVGNPGEIQVYPPLGPGGMAPPVVPPGEMPPEGAIPTVIDPEAPVSTVPVPPVTTPAEPFAAPDPSAVPDASTPPSPAPLPPNHEDLAAEKEKAETPAAPAE